MNKVAIIITCHRMPEYVNALCAHIREFVQWPYELITVDIGHDFDAPPKECTISLKKNVHMTNALLIAHHYADALVRAGLSEPFMAYWQITNSMRFRKGDKSDPLTPMMEFMMANPETAIVSPALAVPSGSAYTCMHNRGTGQIRRVWGVDNIAILLRAGWFDWIGRYDPNLVIGWGPAFETGWIARRDGRGIYVHEGVVMHYDRAIGFKMGRRLGTDKERGERGATEFNKILSAKYGPDFNDKLGNEFVRPEWR